MKPTQYVKGAVYSANSKFDAALFVATGKPLANSEFQAPFRPVDESGIMYADQLADVSMMEPATQAQVAHYVARTQARIADLTAHD